LSAKDRLTIGVVCTRGIGAERGGRVRNEDNYLLCRNNEARYRNGDIEAVETVKSYGTLAVVADGMGGHEDGDLASSAAVRAMARIFRRGLPENPEPALHKFVLDAHKRLHAKVRELGPVRMGTTLTSCWILQGKAVWCHVGDSRLYLYRKEEIRQVTRDHTRAEFAQRDGRPVDSDGPFLAQNFVYGSRGFGDDANIRVDVGADTGVLQLKKGDRLVLCTDGLSGVVEEHRIASALQETPEPQACATSLMERALASGTDDNVTVMVIRIDQPGSGPSLETEVEVSGDDEDTLVPLDTD